MSVTLDMMEYPTHELAQAAYVTSGGYGSDVCTGGTATASGYEAGHPPSLAFDDNNGTYWGTWPVHTFPQWIKYELLSAKVVEKYTIRGHPTLGENPRDWTFQGSNNDSDWDILDTQVGITTADWAAEIFKIFTFSNTTAYKYYKINITANNGGSSGGTAMEIEMMETALQSYSESTIKTQGTYSLKVPAVITASLNETLTRIIGTPIDLSDLNKTKLDVRASRTGTNIKVRIRDSGGTWSEYSIAISTANIWETKEWDISAISNANKDAIDRIQFQITEASGDNTFYLDNMFAFEKLFKKTFTETINLTDTLKKKTNKTFSETLTLNDTITVFRIFHRVFTETLHLSDTVKKKVGKVFTENINLSDVFSRVWTIYRTYTENINLADTVAKKVAKTFTESISLSDILRKKVGKVFAETLTLSDTLKKKVSKVFIETLTLTDTASLFRQFHRVFTETLHLTDTFSRVWSIKRVFTEKITLTDKVKVAKSNLVNLIKKLIHLEDIED